MISKIMMKYFAKEQVNVCIIGGGNIGSLLLGDLGNVNHVSVRLFTSKPEKWSHSMKVCSVDNTIKYTGIIDLISNKPEEVIVNADILLSTLPSHIFSETMQQIKPFIKPDAWIGVMPGSGGVEFYTKELTEIGCTLFGFQRVHGISRIKEYGKSVYDLGKKKELHVAAIPAEKTEDVRVVLELLLGVPCVSLPNYLNITLTPSNPILHTTRLYSLFHNYQEGQYWDREIEFYSEWTDDSSDILIACDLELQRFCQKIKGLNLTGVKSLKEHYESDSNQNLTKKIRSITAFKGIKTPMLQSEKGYIPDFGSRYFQEDFPYGLCIIKGFCDIAGLKTPSIDKVLKWYETVADVIYFDDGIFNGPNLADLPIPQNFDIKTIDEIINYYGRPQ